ncbi:hypothetical protein AB0P15_31030 [Streptomyces sp. NPDC087917]|uniref:hypothetical protein n=1 Tax=Streptomyces sp. NPDC087917 TaxID=3155060 RepID=UPI003423949F
MDELPLDLGHRCEHDEEGPQRRRDSVQKSYVIKRRLLAAGMTGWQLADPLGVHEHQIDLEELPDLPVHILLELARRLDMHPADLMPGSDHLFELPLQRQVADRRPAGADHDALTVLTALAHADGPLTADTLAASLSWTRHRTDTALDHARTHPNAGGVLLLRHLPPEAYTVTPRLDILDATRSTPSPGGRSPTLRYAARSSPPRPRSSCASGSTEASTLTTPRSARRWKTSPPPRWSTPAASSTASTTTCSTAFWGAPRHHCLLTTTLRSHCHNPAHPTDINPAHDSLLGVHRVLGVVDLLQSVPRVVPLDPAMAPQMLHSLRWPAMTLMSCIDAYAPDVHHRSFP